MLPYGVYEKFFFAQIKHSDLLDLSVVQLSVKRITDLVSVRCTSSSEIPHVRMYLMAPSGRGSAT